MGKRVDNTHFIRFFGHIFGGNSKGFSQDFFIDSPEKTTEFFEKNKNISLAELQQLLSYEYQNLKKLYDIDTK